METRRVGERRLEEVLPLQRIALRGIHERRVVKDVLSHHRANQETQVELPPRDLIMETEGEARVGVADDRVIAGPRLGHHTALAFLLPGCGRIACSERRAAKQLFARRVDAHEHGPIEGAERESGADEFRDLARLALRSEEHTSELQSRLHLVCRLLLEKKKNKER